VLAQSLNLDQGWGIGEESFRRIVEEMRAAGVRSIVEFGSGISSIRFALEFPEARSLSIESNREWYESVQRMCDEHGTRNLTVSHRPLRWQMHSGALFLSYKPGELPERVDAVLIDGPPTWTRRGREACLYQVMPRLSIGGHVFLDDFKRNREKTMLRNWQWSYPNTFEVSNFETGHGICVLKKVRDARRPRFSIRSFPDHVIEVLGVIFTHPLRRE
jgi:predicted O-methyltransferase YrrM